MGVATRCQLAPLRRPPQLDRYITNSCGMFVILERSRWVLLLRKMGGWARENVPILKNQRFYSCLSMLNSSEGMGPWYGRTFWEEQWKSLCIHHRLANLSWMPARPI